MKLGLPLKPTVDPKLSFVTMGWLNQLWLWLKQETGVQRAETAAFIAGVNFAYPCDATGAAFAATLPLASTCLGKKYLIKKVDSSANAVTVTASGSDLIDGASTSVISTQYGSVLVISDGVSNWYSVSSSGGGGGGGPSIRTQTINSASGSYTLNMGSYDLFILNLVGDVVLGFSGGIEGQVARCRLVQDMAGIHGVSFDSTVRFSVDLPTFVPTQVGLKTDYIAVAYNAIATKYDFVSFNRGF